MSNPACAAALHSLDGQLRAERVITHNLIVGGGTFAVGFFGVAFQVLVSRHLSPGDVGSELTAAPALPKLQMNR